MRDLTLSLTEDLRTAQGVQHLFVEHSDAWLFLQRSIEELEVRLELSRRRDAELEAALLR